MITTIETLPVKAYFKRYDIIALNGMKFTITECDKFGVTPHYGVVWSTDGVNYHSGWLPCELVDRHASVVNLQTRY